MKTTCLVNNFNYSNFVVEAVNSALNQTEKFTKIAVSEATKSADKAHHPRSSLFWGI
mgnify:CR=1 FL=1